MVCMPCVQLLAGIDLEGGIHMQSGDKETCFAWQRLQPKSLPTFSPPRNISSYPSIATNTTVNMTRTKRDRDPKAAYAASQPLFAALQHGAAQSGTQRAYLSKARDTVQKVHVELVNGDGDQHELYMECAVKAWRSATETFSNVFAELCKITAADPTKGKEASKEYDGFKSLAETAVAAKEAAMGYQLKGERSSAPQSTKSTPSKAAKSARVEEEEEDVATSDSDSEASETSEKSTTEQIPAPKGKRPAPTADEETPPSGQPSTKKLKPANTIRHDEKGHKVLFEKGAKVPNVPFAELSAADKKAWQAEKGRQKREKRRLKKRAGNSAPTPSAKSEGGFSNATFGEEYIPLGFDASEAVPAGKENKVPGVEYEDVTAEVEARLKAKEEKRKARKEEKKRKRESVDSALLAATAAEKPSMKKMKSAGRDGLTVKDVVDKPPKRKQVVADAEEGGKARAKRKKTQV